MVAFFLVIGTCSLFGAWLLGLGISGSRPSGVNRPFALQRAGSGHYSACAYGIMRLAIAFGDSLGRSGGLWLLRKAHRGGVPGGPERACLPPEQGDGIGHSPGQDAFSQADAGGFLS